MRSKGLQRFIRIGEWVLSVGIALLGILLALACVLTAFSSDGFSRERALSFLLWLLLPILLLAALAAWLALAGRNGDRRHTSAKNDAPCQNRSAWIGTPHPAVRPVVLLAAVCLLVLGCCNGGMRDVLEKAIRICTECIGLG